MPGSIAVDAAPAAAACGAALRDLWRGAGLPDQSLGHLTLTGKEPVLPSSFAVGAAAQTSIAAAALAAAEIWNARTGRRQEVGVDMQAAARECTGYFSIDGRVPQVWDKLSGLYACGADPAPAYVRIHANFTHHRDGALRLLALPPGGSTERAAVEQALRNWRAEAFEQAAADAGLVVAAARPFAAWDGHAQGRAVAQLPTLSIERFADAEPIPFPALADAGRPLQDLRVLDLTRILAGPVAGRTLAAYGAEVMLVNSPHLPNIDAIADTSRGKLSAHIDLRTAAGRETLQALARDARVFIQGYRPHGLDSLGFGPGELTRLRPGIVYVSLCAYGHVGPWADRRGFDSLVQTATGFNIAEQEAFGAAQPRALPMQILDYASGYLMAFGAQAALLRQSREGGSWHVRVSLARTGLWLRSFGRIDGVTTPHPQPQPFLEAYESGFGRLMALPHAARFSVTPARWPRRSMPPGSHAPVWPHADMEMQRRADQPTA